MAVAEGAEGVAELDEAGPLHERDEHVDPVGGDDLALDLAPDSEVFRTVDDEVAVAERNGGPGQLAGAEPDMVGVQHLEEPLRGDAVICVHAVVVPCEAVEELVGELDLLGDAFGCGALHRRQDRRREALDVPGQGLGRGVGAQGDAPGVELGGVEPTL